MRSGRANTTLGRMEGGRLVYLYTGSADVESDVAFYTRHLDGEVVWRIRSGGTEVAAIRLGDGPLVLLADHRRAPGVLPIWAVADLGGATERLKEAGWRGKLVEVEVPDGPCVILSDPSGNEIALMDQVRPNVLEARAAREQGG